MQRFSLFYTQSWYVGLPAWEKELVRVSLELFSREERMQSEFADYSFVVFSMAKAYEGFLKKYFYDAGFISHVLYTDKRFRIGRALNPDLNPLHQDGQWVYPRIEEACGREVARGLWDTWLQCRNQIFHYFPENQKSVSLIDAGRCIEMMAQAMEMATLCKMR